MIKAQFTTLQTAVIVGLTLETANFSHYVVQLDSTNLEVKCNSGFLLGLNWQMYCKKKSCKVDKFETDVNLFNTK